jgi:hypothetical protein
MLFLVTRFGEIAAETEFRFEIAAGTNLQGIESRHTAPARNATWFTRPEPLAPVRSAARVNSA